MNFVNLYALTSYDKVSNNKLEKFNKLPKSFSQNVNGATVPYSKMGVSFCANNMVPILNRDNELLKDSAENSTLNNIKTEYPRFANSQLRSELASVEDLRQIHQIDLEAFDGRYEIDSDFDLYKEDLDSQNITTYAIKNANNEIVAYYQLDPVKNGDLYVHSIAVRKDLRNSKQGLASIIEMQKSITEYALANSVQKVTLDVDSANKTLIKLYKKFGFEVVRESVGNDYHDYHMELNLSEVLSENTDSVSSVSTDEEPKQVKNPKVLLNEKKINASEMLKSCGFNNFNTRVNLINDCIEKDSDGNKIFNESKFNAFLEVTNKLKEASLGESSGGFSNLMLEKKGDNYQVRTKLLNRCINLIKNTSSNSQPKYTLSYLDALKSIPSDCDFETSANMVLDYMSAVNCIGSASKIRWIAQNCYKVVDGKKVPNKEMLEIAINAGEFIDLDLLGLACDKNGEISRSRYERLKHLSNTVVQDFSDNYIHAIKKYKDKFPFDLVIHHKDVDYREDFMSPPSIEGEDMIKLIMASTKDMGNGPVFDKARFKQLLNLVNPASPAFFGELRQGVTDVFAACYAPPRFAFSGQPKTPRFQNEMLDCAYKLKNIGRNMKDIAVVLESCKDKDGAFDDDVYNVVLRKLKENPNMPVDCIKYAKVNRTFTYINEEVLDELSGVDFNKYFPTSSSKDEFFSIFKPNEDSEFQLNEFRQVKRDLDILSKNSKWMLRDYFITTPSGLKYEPRYVDLFKFISNHSCGPTPLDDICSVIGNSRNANYATDERSFNSNAYEFTKELLTKGVDLVDLSTILSFGIRLKDDWFEVDASYLDKAKKLLEEGKNVKQIINIARYSSDEKIKLATMLEEQGIDSGCCVNYCFPDEKFNSKNLEMIYKAAQDNVYIDNLPLCLKDNGEFDENYYNSLLYLTNLKFSSQDVKTLFQLCLEPETDYSNKFNVETFDKIKEIYALYSKDSKTIEKLIRFSINNEENTGYKKFDNDLYNRIPDLVKRGYDMDAVLAILQRCKNNTGNPNYYQELLDITKDYLVLKNPTQNGEDVIRKIVESKNSIQKAKELYGEELLNCALPLKVDNYLEFCRDVDTMNDSRNKEFMNDLNAKLDLLVDPNLKLKRLRVIAKLSKFVDEKCLRHLINQIESPVMNQKQIEIAQNIFTLDYSKKEDVAEFIKNSQIPESQKELIYNALDNNKLNYQVENTIYNAQIEEYMQKMSVPPSNRGEVKKFLVSAQLNKNISRPASIEEQISLLDKFANGFFKSKRIRIGTNIKIKNPC